jgi:hypothetical protein
VAREGLEAAALAVVIGVLANTALKFGVALFFGSPRFRTMVGTLVVMIVTAAAFCCLHMTA